jgi:hypothetical protein
LPAPDHGTPELLALRRALTGRIDLPPEPLAVLFSRGFLDQRQYDSALLYAGLTRAVRSGWGVADSSVTGLWRAVTCGEGLVVVAPGTANSQDAPAVDRARRRLEEMRDELKRDDPGGAILRVVDTVAVDGVWVGWLQRLVTRQREISGDWASLGDLREGLGRLAALRGDRRREVSPRAEAAE